MHSSEGLAMPVNTNGVRIESLSDLNTLGEAVELQKTVWGYSDIDAESRALLVIASRFIGQVLGAFDDRKLIGLALAFYAMERGEVHLHSHRVGVLPDYQNSGVGRMLKLAQRKDALARGIGTVQWSFDPMQQRNAHFNLMKLGGVARRYIPNLYGTTSSPLHGGLPTDRLLIEWELESPRVEQVLRGERPPAQGEVARITFLDAGAHSKSVIQQVLREEMMQKLEQGYTVTGFEQTTNGAAYLLETR